ncbi:MAG: hypothetical protein ACD_51C00147G0003 [uncultured bacterium]|nr:MAG: hypothetical protein ACD_51C00147G0003 [uncultured bacterium]
MKPKIHGGQLGACNNLTVSVDEELEFVSGGRAVSAAKVMEEKMPGEVREDTISLNLAGAVAEKPGEIPEEGTPPPERPPKTPPDKTPPDSGNKIPGINQTDGRPDLSNVTDFTPPDDTPDDLFD